MPIKDRDRQLVANRNARLKKSFGIDVGELEDQIAYQGGRCAICGKSGNYGERNLAVDHCHNTGQLRGLLCFRCNLGLGCLKDNPEILRLAIMYLDEGAAPGDKLAIRAQRLASDE